MKGIHYGRKRSGIIKELQAKIDDWLISIEDETVRNMASAGAIVTGGAIASMLLGEKVNDFDLYFRTQETTLAVATYYAEQYNRTGPDIPATADIHTKMNIKGGLEDRVMIIIPSAGVGKVERSKKKKRGKYNVSFISENAITLTDKVQIVNRFYGEPKVIHDNYDFIHAQCYWDNGSKELILPAAAMESLLCRTLHYTGSLYPIASIFRTKKFLERGWRISAGQQLKIMWQISEIDLSNPEVLKEQLTGVDQLYMTALIHALRDVDAEKITSTYVGSIIDRIFQ